MDKELAPLDCLLPSGTQRICLIILNQPLDEDYLRTLWSKDSDIRAHTHGTPRSSDVVPLGPLITRGGRQSSREHRSDIGQESTTLIKGKLIY
ncbi:hypothetical protein INR49_032917, partial [Caranx melampygus]